MITEEIRRELFDKQDSKYRDMQVKIIPTVKADSIIGVRTPELRAYARKLVKEESTDDFLSDLPHKYFDENQLHAFIVSEIKDYERCMEETERFLPYVDNWATCDQMSPKVFKKNRQDRDQYLYKDRHEAIISVEQFEKVQLLHEERQKDRKQEE